MFEKNRLSKAAAGPPRSEAARAVWFALYLFCAVGSMILGKTARDVYFLARFDPALLPWVFVAAAATIAIGVAVHNNVGRRVDLVALSQGSGIIFAVSLPPFLLAGAGWVYAVLYIWVELVTAVMTFQFWMLANRAFTTREAKRRFGLIGAGGSLAGAVVGLSLRPAVGAFGTGWLLPATSLFIVACVGIVAVLRRDGAFRPAEPDGPEARSAARAPLAPARRAPAAEGGRGPLRHLRDPYVAAIAAIVVLSTAVGAIVDYEFKIIAAAAYGEAQLAGLFGLLHGLVGLASLAVQFLVTGRVLARFGVGGGLAVMPAALLAGGVMLVARPFVAPAFALRAVDGVLRFTIHEAASQILWLPVADRVKRSAKPFVDGTLRTAALGAAGLLIALTGMTGTAGTAGPFHLRVVAVIGLALTVLWLLSVRPVRSGYVRSLRDAIADRRLDIAPLTIDTTDRETNALIRNELSRGEPARVAHLIETLEGPHLAPFAGELRRLAETAPEPVRRRVLRLARNEPALLPDDDVLDRLSGPPGSVGPAGDVREEACFAAGVRRLERAGDALASLAAAGATVRERAAADVALRAVRGGSGAGAIETLLASDDAGERLAALDALSAIPGAFDRESLTVRLVPLLDDPCADVRERAIDLAATAEPANAGSAPGVADALVRNLERAESAHAARRALAGLARRPDRGACETLTRAAADRSARCRALLSVRAALEDHPAFGLLRDHADDRLRAERRLLLDLLGCLTPGLPVASCRARVEGGDPAARANALELLDNLLPAALRRAALPAFEGDGHAAHEPPGRPGEPDAAPRAARGAFPDDPYAAVLLLRHDAEAGRHAPSAEEKAMLSVLETSLFLRGVSLFENLPGEEVWRIARIARPVLLAAGEPVFAEDDPGTAMYVLERGRVRIHREKPGHGQSGEIAVLGAGEIFGEMALLDGLPRSASVTAIEDATLLEIGQNDFLALMSGRPEILRGILRVLTARLRRRTGRPAATGGDGPPP